MKTVVEELIQTQQTLLNKEELVLELEKKIEESSKVYERKSEWVNGRYGSVWYIKLIFQVIHVIFLNENEIQMMHSNSFAKIMLHCTLFVSLELLTILTDFIS